MTGKLLAQHDAQRVCVDRREACLSAHSRVAKRGRDLVDVRIERWPHQNLSTLSSFGNR